MKDMQTQLIVNKAYRLELVESDVIALHINGSIDYIKSVQLVEEQKRMAYGKKCKLMVSMLNMEFIDPEAQEYLASPTAQKDISAVSIVINQNSWTARTIVSTFLRLRSSEGPYKIFNDATQALNWLRSI